MGKKLFQRMFDAINKNKSCWLWTGTIDTSGYGLYNSKKAHRLVYEIYHGPIPKGLHLDHLCRNRSCVRPDHLEAVTPKVNVLRGIGKGAKFSRRTHCSKGHEFTTENTYIRTDSGRKCRICMRHHSATWSERHPGITRWESMSEITKGKSRQRCKAIQERERLKRQQENIHN